MTEHPYKTDFIERYGTETYNGVALVETDQHTHGFIILLTEAEIRGVF